MGLPMSDPPQSPHEVDFSKITFLIADEKALFRDMTHSALTKAGAKDVKHAAGIERGLEVLARFGQQIGCVTCDWDMAPIGGLELLRMIRSRALPKTPPRTALVIITPTADAAAVKAAMALDVNGFAVAPLSIDKLIKKISNALGHEWVLKEPAQYAAVPTLGLAQAKAPVPAPVSAKGILLRNSSGEAAPVAATPAKPKAVIGPELINVRTRTLVHAKPGDIVARDIKDPDGQLLLSTGTELTPSLINRLKGVAGGSGSSYHLWVGEWDKAS